MDESILPSDHPCDELEERLKYHLAEGIFIEDYDLRAIEALIGDGVRRGMAYVERLPDGTERPIYHGDITFQQWVRLSALTHKLRVRMKIAKALRYLIEVKLVVPEPGDTIHRQFLEDDPG